MKRAWRSRKLWFLRRLLLLKLRERKKFIMLSGKCCLRRCVVLKGSGCFRSPSCLRELYSV